MQSWHWPHYCKKMYCFQKHHPEVFLWKGVLKICSKFTGEHPCRSAISIKLLSNLIEITLRLGCSTVDLLHIFRTPFHRNTSWWLLLYFGCGSLLRQRALFCGTVARYAEILPMTQMIVWIPLSNTIYVKIWYIKKLQMFWTLVTSFKLAL